MTQHIRRSQFVYTYGPGAIIEGVHGPRLIPLPDKGLFYGEHLPEDFEISDQRVSQGLLAGARVFRLPSNAELGKPESSDIYKTKSFPSWNLCTVCHPRGCYVLYLGQTCPVCHTEGGHIEAIRFVLACPKGHLDDVDWFAVVHGGNSCSRQSKYYNWCQAGSSLSQVQIECPECSRKVNLGWAYRQAWKCSGRFPERESIGNSAERPGCSEKAFMIQRQAANLRIPELRTLFTIPPRATRLHRLLESRTIRTVIACKNSFASKSDFISELEKTAKEGLLERSVCAEINSYDWQDIQQALQDISQLRSSNYSDLILEEFDELLNASVNGYPPKRDRSGVVLFEVDLSKIKCVWGPRRKCQFRIAPLLRLRSVTVQTGYRREVGGTSQPPDVVDVSFTDKDNNRWYPGTEFLGEGIFISLISESVDCRGESPLNLKWKQAWQNGHTDYPDHLFRDKKKVELHPVFVWWHTLSHFLIRAISVDAGYSSAAIRERVYTRIDCTSDSAKGGIVLYATQPGSEGSSGGLISLVPYFDSILQKAIELAEACSNDPLCAENHFYLGKYSGPACYGCALISETSCEHRNLWLDREVLLENAP
ncbi:MAG: hypothetical protein KatS3mg023_2331 [Armatimonadota bacterium]|nr:MAG: hypothetical protein KatS3mg023_2331 [Armatimonadota bacterium]